MTRGGGPTAPAARAWLEALGLEPRLPDGPFFEDLFLRFQRRVACETLTRPAGEASSFDPEAFAAEWPDEERGLTGEERARAFAWLAGELGFEVEIGESLCSRPWAEAERDKGEAHRSVVASIEGRRLLADAAFPLPVLLRLDAPSKEIPTGFGTLSVRVDGEGGFGVECDARGEAVELLRLRHAPPPNPLPLEEISRSAPAALRVLDDRVLYWTGGVMTILDAWSVLRYPLAGTERAAFESLFALNLEGVDLPGVPAADEPAALSVFHAVPLRPDEVRRGLDLAAPVPSALVEARVARIDAITGGSRVALTATLGARVPPTGPGESVRKTLVFHLAMDLLGLGGAGPA